MRVSRAFDIQRGVIQGDIISPIFFILTLDELVKCYDKEYGQGVTVGHIHELRVLGYADDAAMLNIDVEGMTKRLTKFADKAIEKADMQVKLQKTFSQMVFKQVDPEKATAKELKAKKAQYQHACKFVNAGCKERFKTARGMKIHIHSCTFRFYYESMSKSPVEKIVGVYGRVERRHFLVRWEGRGPQSDTWGINAEE